MTDQDSEPLSESRIFDLLSNERRRRTVKYLQANGGRASLDELVDTLATIENDVPPEELKAAQRRRIRVSLTQSHLPKLVSVGVIAYDEDRNVVRRGEHAATVEAYITTENGRARWPWYYVMLSVGAIALFVISGLGRPVAAGLSPLIVGAAVVVGLVGLSVTHLVAVRRRT